MVGSSYLAKTVFPVVVRPAFPISHDEKSAHDAVRLTLPEMETFDTGGY